MRWKIEGFASSDDRRRAVDRERYYAKKALQQAASAVQPPLHLPVPPVMMAMPSTEEMEDIWHLATGTPPPSASTPPSFYVPPASISVPLHAAAHFPFVCDRSTNWQPAGVQTYQRHFGSTKPARYPDPVQDTVHARPAAACFLMVLSPAESRKSRHQATASCLASVAQ